MLHSEGATPRLTYEKSEQEFENAQSEHDGLAKLAKQADDRIQSLLEELRNARKILDEKQKAVEEASGALSAAEVRSPVDGVVVSRTGEVGKSAQDQGADLFQIATDIQALEVFLEPDPGALKRIKAGQPALAIVSDLRAEPIPAKVSKVQDDGNVLVEFTSPDPAIKPGMVADVRIRVD
jgi:HlyD family secretion protein